MSGLRGIVDFAAPRAVLEPCRVTGLVRAVFDGRLDNRSELIARLAPAAPADGPAVSDAGLLRAAYLEWGEACAGHLLGDFAFAIWDGGRRRLFCAVDPLGLRPLHYAQTGTLLVFASDAVEVLRHPAVPDDYDEREIAAWLASQPEHPEHSFFAAIRKLPPGHRLTAEAGALRVERYWDPRPAEIRYARDEDYAAHFREIFACAVADRLRGAGSFAAVTMSGGLDSTSVAAMAHRTPGAAVRAYTFAFDRLTECDERDYSRAMTEELGLEVEPVAIERLWRLEPWADLPASDTPYSGWSTCYAEIFRGMAAGGSRVLLTGHGGDDVMRGSPLACTAGEVVRHARARRSPVLPALYRRFGRPHLPARVDRLLRAATGHREAPLLPAFVRADFARRAGLTGRLEALRPRKAFRSPARQEVYGNLVGTPWYWRTANWHGRNAAPFGIDVRHPFLDRRLVEHVLAVPGEQLFRLGSTKDLLRRSMAGLLPETIRRRPGKTSFIPLLDSMIRREAPGEIAELLSAPRCAELGFVDGDALRSVLWGYLNGGADGERRAVWYAITLEIWLRRCEAIRRERRCVEPSVWAAA